MHILHIRLLPLFDFVYESRISGNPKCDSKWRDENNVVEDKITETIEVSRVVMQKSDNHKVRTAHAWELAETDQKSKSKGGRKRYDINEFSYRAMRYVRNFEPNRKLRKKRADKVEQSEKNQHGRAELAHEMRRVENVQDLEETDTDSEVGGEDSGDVETADLKNFHSGHL